MSDTLEQRARDLLALDEKAPASRLRHFHYDADAAILADLARAYLSAAADLRQFERSTYNAWDALRLLDEATHIAALNVGPLADAVDHARDSIRTLIEGRTRPEWTFDKVLRERDEARVALAALTEEHARLKARHAALVEEGGR